MPHLKISAEQKAQSSSTSPVETEEIVLGFEIPDLQNAMDLSMDAWPALAGASSFRSRAVFRALRIIKVRQAIAPLLGVRQNC
uniref:hypothetical protein n=1 Tax=Escherichia coli TaxID=562 RepID=UPI001BCC7389|nr:hypothetical protein [Escherichia coli]QUN03743.1 hypothetical protein [Escherichia coli]